MYIYIYIYMSCSLIWFRAKNWKYTLEQLLNHPWVNGDSAKEDPMDAEVVSRLKSFNARRKLRAVALASICCSTVFSRTKKLKTLIGSYDLTAEEIENLRIYFKKMWVLKSKNLILTQCMIKLLSSATIASSSLVHKRSISLETVFSIKFWQDNKQTCMFGNVQMCKRWQCHSTWIWGGPQSNEYVFTGSSSAPYIWPLRQ